MEHTVYLIVKGLSTVYILYNVYRFLSGQRAANFWRFMMPEIKAKETPAAPQAKPEQTAYSIVGKSQTVYLEEPPKEETKAVEPAFSEDLQKIPSYEEEPDTVADDVEYNPGSQSAEDILSEEERFIPFDSPPEEGESTGMTFEQISEALDVVQGRLADNAGKAATARILYETEGSDLFNFLAAQAENEALIEKLLRENLDDSRVPLPENTRKHKREMEEFDMGKYV